MKRIIGLIRHPSRLLARVHGGREAGMATAEYAVGTVAVVGFGTILYKLMTSPEVRDAVWNVILWLIRLITGINA